MTAHYKGIFYLNNNGSRWVMLENGKKIKVTLYTESGKPVTRTAIEFRLFGNFVSVVISYKGEKINVLTDSVLKD